MYEKITDLSQVNVGDTVICTTDSWDGYLDEGTECTVLKVHDRSIVVFPIDPSPERFNLLHSPDEPGGSRYWNLFIHDFERVTKYDRYFGEFEDCVIENHEESLRHEIATCLREAANMWDSGKQVEWRFKNSDVWSTHYLMSDVDNHPLLVSLMNPDIEVRYKRDQIEVWVNTYYSSSEGPYLGVDHYPSKDDAIEGGRGNSHYRESIKLVEAENQE
jgi:hypothetical protein